MKIKNKQILKGSFLALLAVTSAKTQAEGFGFGTIDVASNYLFRGVTLSDDGAAVQATVGYDNGAGLYGGIWASNTTLEDSGSYEIDLYFGKAGKVGAIDYDVGLVSYFLPEAKDVFGVSIDYSELYAKLSYNWLTFGVNYIPISRTDDTAAAEAYIEGDTWFFVQGNWGLGSDWSVSATLGQQTFSDDGVEGADFDYTHTQIDLTKSVGDFGDFTFSLSKTNGSDIAVDDNLQPVVKWTKNF